MSRATLSCTEAHLQPSQTSKMERFAKIANGFSFFQIKKENLSEGSTAQKKNLSSRYFFSKCYQIQAKISMHKNDLY